MPINIFYPKLFLYLQCAPLLLYFRITSLSYNHYMLFTIYLAQFSRDFPSPFFIGCKLIFSIQCCFYIYSVLFHCCNISELLIICYMLMCLYIIVINCAHHLFQSQNLPPHHEPPSIPHIPSSNFTQKWVHLPLPTSSYHISPPFIFAFLGYLCLYIKSIM